MTEPLEGALIEAAPLFGDHMPIRMVPPNPGGNTSEQVGDFVIETDFKPPHLNRAGSVHGGLIASFLDVAVAGGAGHAAGDLEKWFGVTLTLTVNYVAAASPGKARAVARSLGGRTTRTMQAHLFDSTGTLAASAQATVRVIPRP